MLKATCLYTFLRQKFHFNPSRQTESLSCGKQRRFGTDAVANHDNQHLWPGSRAQEVCLMRQLGAEDACQECLASSGNLLEGLWQSLQRNPKLPQLLRTSGYEASTTFGAKHDNLWRILTAVIASGQKIIYIHVKCILYVAFLHPDDAAIFVLCTAGRACIFYTVCFCHPNLDAIYCWRTFYSEKLLCNDFRHLNYSYGLEESVFIC